MDRWRQRRTSFINGFSTSKSNTSFVFRAHLNSPGQTNLNISHEAGHLFGLRHHSLYDVHGHNLEDYAPGTPRVGPLMGAAFASCRMTLQY